MKSASSQFHSVCPATGVAIIESKTLRAFAIITAFAADASSKYSSAYVCVQHSLSANVGPPSSAVQTSQFERSLHAVDAARNAVLPVASYAASKPGKNAAFAQSQPASPYWLIPYSATFVITARDVGVQRRILGGAGVERRASIAGRAAVHRRIAARRRVPVRRRVDGRRGAVARGRLSFGRAPLRNRRRGRGARLFAPRCTRRRRAARAPRRPGQRSLRSSG